MLFNEEEQELCVLGGFVLLTGWIRHGRDANNTQGDSLVQESITWNQWGIWIQGVCRSPSSCFGVTSTGLMVHGVQKSQWKPRAAQPWCETKRTPQTTPQRGLWGTIKSDSQQINGVTWKKKNQTEPPNKTKEKLADCSQGFWRLHQVKLLLAKLYFM